MTRDQIPEVVESARELARQCGLHFQFPNPEIPDAEAHQSGAVLVLQFDSDPPGSRPPERIHHLRVHLGRGNRHPFTHMHWQVSQFVREINAHDTGRHRPTSSPCSAGSSAPPSASPP